jgi:hypothetical protein
MWGGSTEQGRSTLRSYENRVNFQMASETLTDGEIKNPCKAIAGVYTNV